MPEPRGTIEPHSRLWRFLRDYLHGYRPSPFALVDAYRSRLRHSPRASLNEFLIDMGLAPSALYEQFTPEHCLLLWHATELRHRANVLKFGLFQHRGVFFAPPTYGLPIGMADGIPARLKNRPESLMVLACLFDRRSFTEGRDYFPGTSEYRFTARIAPDAIFAIITEQGVDCVGPTASRSVRFTSGRFSRTGRSWAIPHRNPCHFSPGRTFRTPEQWLSHYLEFLFARNEQLTLDELLCGIHLNVTPPDALTPDLLLSTFAAHCITASTASRKEPLLRVHPYRENPDGPAHAGLV